MKNLGSVTLENGMGHGQTTPICCECGLATLKNLTRGGSYVGVIQSPSNHRTGSSQTTR